MKSTTPAKAPTQNDRRDAPMAPSDNTFLTPVGDDVVAMLGCAPAVVLCAGVGLELSMPGCVGVVVVPVSVGAGAGAGSAGLEMWTSPRAAADDLAPTHCCSN